MTTTTGTLRAGAALEAAAAAAVVVHGRTLDPEYMMDNLVGALGVDEVAYLLPRHPDRTWYAGRYTQPAAALEPDLGAALDAIEAEIAAARDAGLPDERIVLAGFSQGACLLAELLARRSRRFGAAAILTGSLFGPEGDVARPGPELAGMPMYFSGGRQDDWVALARVEATATIFAQAGADVTCVAHDDVEHHIRDADRSAVRALITATVEA
ncbi:MAG: phospholipase/carboxylesterase [Baekduia sp.]|nr:phospholipase/carboxylesterase [Baekduia sp.]